MLFGIFRPSTDCGWCASGHSFSMLNTNRLIAYEGCVIVELCVCVCVYVLTMLWLAGAG